MRLNPLHKNDTRTPGIVFLSGGSVYGAFTGGLQAEGALEDVHCPAIYLTTSAGFPNALARVVAEHRIDLMERKQERMLTPLERSVIISGVHDHLWESIVRKFGPMMPADNSLSGILHDGYADNAERFLPFAALTAQVVHMNEAAMRNVMHPVMWGGYQTAKSMMRQLQPTNWAHFLREVFPDADAALKSNATPRIIANAFDFGSTRSRYFDSDRETLDQLVATMGIVGQTMLTDLRYGDGAYTGYNGDYFHILQHLVDEDRSYAEMTVTFINLGEPDMASPAAMKSLNPKYEDNRAHAEESKAWVKQHWRYREFALDREKWLGGKAKRVVTPAIVAELQGEGRRAYHEANHFTKPPQRPVQAFSNRSQSAPQAA